MRIVLIHGYKASPKHNFFPWLKTELKKRGHEVIAPDLPSAKNPDAEEWTKHLIEEVGAIDEETIIVGHSLGAAAALRFLEAAEAHSTPRGCVLVSSPWMIHQDNLRGFFLSELDFDVLMWKASRFIMIHSKDDDVIPFDHAEKYHDVLHGRLVEREHGEGHFQGKKYEVILQEIEKLIGEEIIYEPGKSLENEYADVR